MGAKRERFVFALCNPGSERALKLEVGMSGLSLRPSYQRRGFVTFKVLDKDLPKVLQLNLACALRLCLSEGKFDHPKQAEAWLLEAKVALIQRMKFEDHRIRPQPGGDDRLPECGMSVGTIVELSETECWAGVHEHGAWLSPYPGGNSGLVMPEAAPSRAWLKFEDALRFFGLEFSREDLVVELGCAPGGVVHALLQRGVSVVGVDPARMDAGVMAHAIARREDASSDRAWFYHCRKPAALVAKRDLGQGVSWFMSDMNQTPEVVLSECARFCKMSPSICGVLITLKLGKLEEIERKASWLGALRELGFTTVRLQQLPSHHREFALLGLR